MARAWWRQPRLSLFMRAVRWKGNEGVDGAVADGKLAQPQRISTARIAVSRVERIVWDSGQEMAELSLRRPAGAGALRAPKPQ
jgi:hypothetical protein